MNNESKQSAPEQVAVHDAASAVPSDIEQTTPGARPETSVATSAAVSKKKHRGLLYVFVIIIVLGLGVSTGWFLAKDVSTDKPQKTAATKTASGNISVTKKAETALQPEDVTAKIKTALAAKYTLLDADTVTTLQNGQVSVRTVSTSPAYQTDGYDFYNNYDGGSTLYLSGYSTATMPLPSASEVAIRGKIVTVYSDLGLTRVISYGPSESSTDVYTGRGLVCTVDDGAAAINPSTASCGLLSHYKEAAAKAKPFASVLPDLTATTVLSNLKISDSKVSGYQKATLSRSDLNEVGGGMAIFYRKGTGSWIYFRGTQEIIDCTAYNTTDLKNAFMGDSCYDSTSNKESTVQ